MRKPLLLPAQRASCETPLSYLSSTSLSSTAVTVRAAPALPSWTSYVPGLSREILKVNLAIFSGWMVIVRLATCSPFTVSSAVKLPAMPPVLITCAVTVASCPASTSPGVTPRDMTWKEADRTCGCWEQAHHVAAASSKRGRNARTTILRYICSRASIMHPPCCRQNPLFFRL